MQGLTDTAPGIADNVRTQKPVSEPAGDRLEGWKNRGASGVINEDAEVCAKA